MNLFGDVGSRSDYKFRRFGLAGCLGDSDEDAPATAEDPGTRSAAEMVALEPINQARTDTSEQRPAEPINPVPFGPQTAEEAGYIPGPTNTAAMVSSQGAQTYQLSPEDTAIRATAPSSSGILLLGAAALGGLVLLRRKKK